MLLSWALAREMPQSLTTNLPDERSLSWSCSLPSSLSIGQGSSCVLDLGYFSHYGHKGLFLFDIVVTIKSCSHMASWAGSSNSETLLSSHSLSGARLEELFWECRRTSGARIRARMGEAPQRKPV